MTDFSLFGKVIPRIISSIGVTGYSSVTSPHRIKSIPYSTEPLSYQRLFFTTNLTLNFLFILNRSTSLPSLFPIRSFSLFFVHVSDLYFRTVKDPQQSHRSSYYSSIIPLHSVFLILPYSGTQRILRRIQQTRKNKTSVILRHFHGHFVFQSF